MDDIAIRPADESDRDAVEALIAECYAAIYPDWYSQDVLDIALPQMVRIDQALLSSGHYFAAHLNGVLAGCGGLSQSAPGKTPDEEATGHIRHFAIRTDLMRKGIGGALIRTCLAEAQQCGMRRMKCFSSLAAEGFYARNGFQRIDETTVMLGGRVPLTTVLMERELKRKPPA